MVRSGRIFDRCRWDLIWGSAKRCRFIAASMTSTSVCSGRPSEWARTQLDELLLANLGEPLGQHGDLLAGLAARRPSAYSFCGNLGGLDVRKRRCGAFWRVFGAFSSGWDVRVPCDDETARCDCRLRAAPVWPAGNTGQNKGGAAPLSAGGADAGVSAAACGHSALQSLVLLVRDAMRVAEDDDLLFSGPSDLSGGRCARAVPNFWRWDGSPIRSFVFDLPWRPWRAGQDQLDYPADVDLSRLARAARHDRLAAQKLLPPQRIVAGRPEWDLPDGRTLSGSGISATQSVVTGRALVVPSLDDPEASLRIVLSQLSPDTILVLPTLLPSWAPAVWGHWRWSQTVGRAVTRSDLGAGARHCGGAGNQTGDAACPDRSATACRWIARSGRAVAKSVSVEKMFSGSPALFHSAVPTKNSTSWALPTCVSHRQS